MNYLKSKINIILLYKFKNKNKKMNSKLQKLNEKILTVINLCEQNNNNNNIIKNSSREKESNLNDNFNINTNINIDKNIILKGKINSLENEYNLKISKLQSKYDNLNNEIEELNNILNFEYESDNTYNVNLIQEINNIKNNFENEFDHYSNTLEQEINYYSQNLNSKILSIENFYINELLKDKKNILDLEKFSQEIISDILNKISLYNINSDNDKKEKSQEICKGLIDKDEELNNERKENEKLLLELKNKFNDSINKMINNFINIESNKREKFKNNIFQILLETLNNILANRKNK